MHIPKFWARAAQGPLCVLGWSDESPDHAERCARERLAKGEALRRGDLRPEDWDYYPRLPVREEILDRPAIPGLEVVVTRNRAGAEVLNADRAAFVDVDLPSPRPSLLGLVKKLFASPLAQPGPATAALRRIEAWAFESGALLRAWRTARGFRLLRLDRPMDPASEETERMFAALEADPKYRRLCRLQKSFRARLTPKPDRIGLRPSSGNFPRTDPAIQRGFEAWRTRYEEACRGRRVCERVADYGPARPDEGLRALAELHDRRTLAGEGPLV